MTKKSLFTLFLCLHCISYSCADEPSCEIGVPLDGWFCGRGGTPCPDGYKCNIHPTDKYAVCCEDDVCQMRPVTGLCEAYIPSWFYNKETKRCEMFIYGGCNGNGNRFPTKEDCEKKCLEPCLQPVVPGTCTEYVKKWHYNPTTGRCEIFRYGGCGGNMNKFDTEAACLKECADTCQLPADTGPCEALIQKWFFNSQTDQCEMFRYGGCLGNTNNFNTKADCEARCATDVCDMPKDVGPCDAVVPRWFYNRNTESCEAFDYGGCLGNQNNFQTKAQCQRRCSSDICSLPLDSGPCEANVPSWHYNSKAMACQRFQYGGCEGNANRFVSEVACQMKCSNKCYLSPKPGPCKAYFTRWYYNPSAGRCESFIYGGCQGNGNNFLSKQDCALSCDKCETDCKGRHCPAGFVMKGECPRKNCKCHCPCLVKDKETKELKPKCKKPDTCVLRRVLCKGLLPCPFEADCKNLPPCPYGDTPFPNVFCGRGPTRQDCPKGYACEIEPADRYAVCCLESRCGLPPDSGCGKKKQTRWYYDKVKGCTKFIYTGTGGNKNRFRTRRACKKACKKYSSG